MMRPIRRESDINIGPQVAPLGRWPKLILTRHTSRAAMDGPFALLQFDDYRLDPLLRKRIEPAQELAKVGNFLLELVTLIAHGSPRWFRREQTRSQSSMATEVGAMMTLTVPAMSGSEHYTYFGGCRPGEVSHSFI